VVHKITTRL